MRPLLHNQEMLHCALNTLAHAGYNDYRQTSRSPASRSSPDEAYSHIWSPQLAFNQAAVGHAKGEPYALEIRSRGDAQIKGGLWALSLWGSFYFALVVIPENLRGKGVGTELMRRAEQEARIRGCRQM